MFLTPQQVRAANAYVESQDAERNPRFPRKDFGGALIIRGDILRYSTTSAPRDEEAQRA
jgi:hypothetical protein